MQQSLPMLPASSYPCSLSFATIRHAGIVIVTGDLSDGMGVRGLYTFSLEQGFIEVHALPTRIPLASTLIAVLHPNVNSPWRTPSDTSVAYRNAINPRTPAGDTANIPSLVQDTLQLGAGSGFRISMWSGRDIDLSIVTGTARSMFRVYRVRA